MLYVLRTASRKRKRCRAVGALIESAQLLECPFFSVPPAIYLEGVFLLKNFLLVIYIKWRDGNAVDEKRLTI